MILDRIEPGKLGSVAPGSPIRHRTGTIGAVELVEPDRVTILCEVPENGSRSAPGKHPERCRRELPTCPGAAGEQRGRQVDAGDGVLDPAHTLSPWGAPGPPGPR